MNLRQLFHFILNVFKGNHKKKFSQILVSLLVSLLVMLGGASKTTWKIQRRDRNDH